MNGFLHPGFLAGLAAVAIPIVIHILTRDRVRKVAFSTLRFFVQGARVTLRRKRWSEVLLIALRVLVCALAALVFARPFRQAAGAGGPSYPRARLVVVDTSASMARAGGDTLAATARHAIDDAPSGTAVGLIAFDRTPRTLAPLDARAPATAAAAEALAPGDGSGDLAPALRLANDTLRAVDARHKEIILISDLQRSGLESYRGDWRLDPGIVLLTATPDATPAADFGVADAQYPRSLVRDSQPRAISVRLINRGRDDLQGVPVVLTLNGTEVERQTVRLPAGASVPVRFWHVFDRAGDNPGEIRALGEDADAGDNGFTFNARVIPEIPVVLAGLSAAAGQGARFFLQAALNPGPGTPFAVKATPAAPTTADLAGASVLVLADAMPTDPALVQATRKLLERGGGVLFLPGDGTAPDTFWSAWSAVAPCRLKRVIDRRNTPGAAEGALGKVDSTHPVFEIFQRPHSGDFSTVRFARYWDVTESQASRVLARFDDGRPAILERQVGQGVASIWLSPPDPAWNNLPLRAIFLPLLQETVRQAAVRTEWQTVYAVGDLPALPDGYSLAGQDAGDPLALGAGLHQLTNAAGSTLCYAFNRPFAEADPRRLEPEELKAAFEQPAADDAIARAGILAPGGAKREYWAWLAAALALLLLAELWLGNRTARH